MLGRGDAAVGAREAAAMRHFRAADPVELQRIEIRVRVLHEGEVGNVAADRAEHGAVLRRLVVEKIGRDQRAGARHVLDDEVRIAGNILAHVARDDPRPGVVVARRRADDDADLLAAVEVRNRCAPTDGKPNKSERARKCRSPHGVLPCTPCALFVSMPARSVRGRRSGPCRSSDAVSRFDLITAILASAALTAGRSAMALNQRARLGLSSQLTPWAS